MLEIFFHRELDSTQTEAKRRLEDGLEPPFCIVADIQIAGMGSRENRWDSRPGNLFFSFVLRQDQLPSDLPLASASIYFGYIMKLTLEADGSTAWLKWPNDLYIKNQKIGGVITHAKGKNLICGIGLNLTVSENYAALDVKTDKKTLLNSYIANLKKFPEWKKIFRKFSVEFNNSIRLKTHAGGEELSLENASLECDGSLIINGKRVFSLR